MSVQRLQTTNRVKTGFVDTVDLTFPSAVSAGSLIVAWITVANGVAVDSVTDTRGNTYVPLTTGFAAGHQTCGLWYAENAQAGATVLTINPHGGGDLIAAIAAEYSGIATSNSLRTSGPRSQAAVTAATSRSVAALAGDLIVSTFSPNGSEEAWTPGAQQTTVGADTASGGGFATLSADERIVAADGTYALSWSGTVAVDCDSFTAVFKAATGGGVALTGNALDIAQSATLIYTATVDATVRIAYEKNVPILVGPTTVTVANGYPVPMNPDADRRFDVKGGQSLYGIAAQAGARIRYIANE